MNGDYITMFDYLQAYTRMPLYSHHVTSVAISATMYPIMKIQP